jgi:hypothetical protein
MLFFFFTEGLAMRRACLGGEAKKADIRGRDDVLVGL